MDGPNTLRRLVRRELAWFATLALAGASHGQTYHVQDLGSLGGLGDTEAFGLAPTGRSPRVAGFATRADHAHRAFAYDGVIQEIAPFAPDTQSIAYGVDGQGRVVGAMYQLGELGARAFRADAAGTALLGEFAPRAVNAAGEIAGFLPVTESVGFAGELKFDRACVFRGNPPTVQQLGALNGSHWSRSYGISATGRVVGCSGLPDDSGSRAVMWLSGPAVDLGTPGGAEACAYAIAGDRVVGYWLRAGTPAARAGAMWTLDSAGAVVQRTDLGTLPPAPGAPATSVWSYAYGVNARGAAVGTSNGRAVLFDGGRVQDLNGLIAGTGWFVVAARAINNDEVIAAWGVNSVNEPRALLLVPCPGDFNRDGDVTVQDLFDFLAAYFGGEQAADVNGSGTVSVQDIFDFLGAWFAGEC